MQQPATRHPHLHIPLLLYVALQPHFLFEALRPLNVHILGRIQVADICDLDGALLALSRTTTLDLASRAGCSGNSAPIRCKGEGGRGQRAEGQRSRGQRGRGAEGVA